MAGLRHLRRKLHQHHRRDQHTYTLAASDVGHTIRVVVTATNPAAPPATSAATATVTAPARRPPTRRCPTITGTATQGQTLTTSQRRLERQPHQLHLPVAGLRHLRRSCTKITGATSSTYTLTAGDVGDTDPRGRHRHQRRRLRLHKLANTATVAASGGGGGGGGGGTPVNSTLPSISGTPEPGGTLTATTGTWTNSPTCYTYQWYDETTADQRSG